MFQVLRRVPLVTKVVLLTLSLGGATWLVLDGIHSRQLRLLFEQQLLEQLERQSGEDRLFLDRYIRSHNQVAKLIGASEGLLRHVAAQAPEGGEGAPKRWARAPGWYPPSSLLRIFSQPRFTLLVDVGGRVREVYSASGAPPPGALSDPGILVRKLSHEEGLLTRLDGVPYLVSAARVGDVAGRGSVILATPLDDEFLYAAQKPGVHDNLTALVDDQVVIASNRPDVVAPGTALDALDGQYVVTGKSFFDYGISDLQIAFMSLRPAAQVRTVVERLVSDERRQRAITAAVLMAGFLLVTLWVRRHVKAVSASIGAFSREALDVPAQDLPRGDELYGLEQQFRQFQHELLRSRAMLEDAVAAKTRKSLEAAQQAQLVSLLRAVTEASQVGVLSYRPAGLKPENGVMERLVADFGGVEPFRLGAGEERDERQQEDRRGSLRAFELRRSRQPGGWDFLLVQEVTDQHEAQRRLRLAGEVIENSTQGMFVAGAAGLLELTNPALARLFECDGRRAVEEADTFLGLLFATPAEQDRVWDELLEQRRWEGEIARRGGDGEPRYLWVRVDAVQAQDDVVLYYVGIVADVSERHRAQETLRRYADELQRSNEEIRRFAYIVSHDLRSPLVNIKGFVSELRFALGEMQPVVESVLPQLGERQRRTVEASCHTDIPEALDYIESGVRRMDRLIGAILTLSRLGRRELRPERLDMDALVAEILDTFHYELDREHVQVEVSVLPAVRADRAAMEQIVANLLGNALKYHDPARPLRVRVWAARSGAATRFFVADNGRGIAEADRDKVFAIFRRAGKADVPGEGMGLAYVQLLVRRHGGHIDFESVLGEGATFHFTVPDALPEALLAGNEHESA